ncbi:MAG TPA: BadF/BadG/BcrA/BcrD ATPase family protein [Gaiellaceae bacterium]|nr:BadF/BadG/BcrA/BcrD ATPase family protein [Gaiellaceae bacterium]
MGLILGVDGGNSKTALLVATTEGEILSTISGPGTNSHAVGAEAVADVIGALIAETGAPLPVEQAVFFLCGADVPSDIDSLERAIDGRGWASSRMVDNDTFALLRAGTDGPDAVAVICGAGMIVVGRASRGRIARYPSLGWETGDWGGAQMLGREVLRLAARAEDGRGEPTVLAEIVRGHFDAPTVESVGADVHYEWIPQARLAELAPKVVAAAVDGDTVARSLVERLADEIVLMTRRALRDLGVTSADVVLGGGMLASGHGLLYDLVLERLPEGARAIAAPDPPVLGAALAALDATGATDAAKARLRGELRGG